MNADLRAERLPIAFMWVDADAQPEFAATFKTPAPAFIALTPRKRKYAAMRGSFQPKNLYDFTNAVVEVAFPTGQPAVSGDAARDAAMAQAAARSASLVHWESVEAIPPLVEQAPLVTKKAAGKKAAGGAKRVTKKKAPASAGSAAAKEEL